MQKETDQPIDKRRRDAHPETITIGDKVYVRNDIAAAKIGETVKTADKRDRHGAPYQYLGGIKYRPQPDFDQHILSGIRSQKPKQQPKRRRVR